jgi:hypothetical protein
MSAAGAGSSKIVDAARRAYGRAGLEPAAAHGAAGESARRVDGEHELTKAR